MALLWDGFWSVLRPLRQRCAAITGQFRRWDRMLAVGDVLPHLFQELFQLARWDLLDRDPLFLEDLQQQMPAGVFAQHQPPLAAHGFWWERLIGLGIP